MAKKRKKRGKGGDKVSPRLANARALSEREIAKKQAEDRARLRDQPALIGYSGPKPAKGMHFEVQRWDTVTHGWSHECYAPTEEAAKVQGRRRLGTFGHRWAVRKLIRGGGLQTSEGTKKKTKKKKASLRRGSGGGVTRKSPGTTVTGYDASKPQPRSGPKEDPDRTGTERAMAAEIARICESRGTVKPKGLGQMREPELRAALERLGGQMP